MKTTKWTPEGKKEYMREYYLMGKKVDAVIEKTPAEIEKETNEEHLKTIFGVEHEDVMI